MHRAVLRPRLGALTHAIAASTSTTTNAVSARCVVATAPHRCMSAGSKRDGKNGLPVRSAGGIRLPDEDQELTHTGEARPKSRAQAEREERAETQAKQAAAYGKEYASKHGRRKSAEEKELDAEEAAEPDTQDGETMSQDAYLHGTPEEREMAKAFELMEREEMRPQEQAFRGRQLTQAGILPGQLPFQAEKATEFKQQKLQAKSAKHNPVLVQVREHLNQSDLPAAFDHFKVPPLTADEIDSKKKALHAAYWSQFAAWKEARPAEYDAWLARLKKRENEQEFHLAQTKRRGGQTQALARQQSLELLPREHRDSFQKAVAEDPALKQAVEQLGEAEVLRRWSAYHVFLEAEHAAETVERNRVRLQKNRLAKDRALHAEDAVRTINDNTLNLSMAQRKKVYYMMLGAKRRVEDTPFWTHPDPRYEGEHDWKMADAFLKPPVLPPMHLLRHFSARPHMNSHFSSLHRFLHFERLRQTVTYLREQKKSDTRTRKQAYVEIVPYAEGLITQAGERWSRMQKTYPFLADAFLTGVQHLHRAPWAPADQKDFVDALHRNVLKVASMLDMHFSRRGAAAMKDAPIVPFPNNPRSNPDEVLTRMTPRQLKRMEAELLAGKMMQMLEEQEQQGGQTAPATVAQ